MNPTPDKQSVRSIHCRICHEDGNTEELIDPCECSGTVGLIHTSCLEKWLTTSNSTQCEICKYAFPIKKKNKPLTQSIWQWWLSKNGYGPQGIGGDLVCLVVLTPLCVAATYLCAVGAAAYTRNGFWEGTGLAVLCFMLVATYALWLIVTVRFHYKSWRDWCHRHQDVKLLVKHRPLHVNNEMKNNKTPVKSENNDNTNRHVNAMDHYHNTGRLSPWFIRLIARFGDPFHEFHQTTWV
ncbi:E3 ubiquitin-protein ligase MARCH2 [Diachasma alloeum]|uniref:E3 ubiquitin-protein ligase MARCH2 n=1 Tax=Diachasma alloeum TaxID=454923 RepID=UPI00073825E8|nr:E3 ubiquitin-protein ligase MARCH2 [Diachasma alloeum]